MNPHPGPLPGGEGGRGFEVQRLLLSFFSLSPGPGGEGGGEGVCPYSLNRPTRPCSSPARPVMRSFAALD